MSDPVLDEDPIVEPAAVTLDDDTVVLPAECKLHVAEELKDLFRTVPTEVNLILDASGVEKVGSASVLAIASMIHTRHEAAVNTAIKGAPPAVIDGFKDMGLFQELMKMEFQ